MSCCSSHDGNDSKKKEAGKDDKNPPKSIISKYLYNLGKKDLEKENQSGEHKGDCC